MSLLVVAGVMLLFLLLCFGLAPSNRGMEDSLRSRLPISAAVGKELLT